MADDELRVDLVAICARCGQVLDVIPVGGEGGWSLKAAEQWAYLANVSHKPRCPALTVAPPPGAPASA